MGTQAGGGRYYSSRQAQSLSGGVQVMQSGPTAPGGEAQAYPPATSWPAQSTVDTTTGRGFQNAHPIHNSQSHQTSSIAAVYDTVPSPTVRNRAKSLGARVTTNPQSSSDERPPASAQALTTKRHSTHRRPVGKSSQDSKRSRPVSYPAESIDPVMESFSVRSPLQELEDKFTSKELKRQKLREAEHRANQRKLKRRSRNADPALDSIESFELPLQGLQQRRMSTSEETETASHVRRSRSERKHNRLHPGNTTNDITQSAPAVNIPPVHHSTAGQYQNRSSENRRQDARQSLPTPDEVPADQPIMQVRNNSYSVNNPVDKATDVPAVKQQPKRIAHDVDLDPPSDDDSSSASVAESQFHLSTPRRILRHASIKGDTAKKPGYFTRLKSALASHNHSVSVQEARRAELGSAYRVTPKTSAVQQAGARVAFADAEPLPVNGTSQDATARFSGILAATSEDDHLESALPPPPPLEEWRRQNVARLILDDFALNAAIVGSRSNSKRHRSLDGASDDKPTTFSPPMYLKCGPLLRYTGMRRERRARPGQTTITEREVWRGTVMIVTEDDKSSYQTVPSLRLFAQSVAPQPDNADPTDLIAGRKTTSRTGRTLYIKPADQLPPHEDLSKVENGRGLFDTKRYGESPRYAFGSPPSIDGEKAGKVRHVNAIRLHKERGLTFWRFQLEIELGTKQARVAYRINNGPAIGFWVPGRNQSMNIMFHSCNGFSVSVDPKRFSGPDPLWRDVLNSHERTPYHVMIGGGDQVYNDAVVKDTRLFREWMNIKNPDRKQKTVFTRQMQNELEQSYLQRYCTWFSQGLFKVANSQIPMVNMWDDHDIIDGYGSYPHHLMASRVFTGLGAVAFKYYMLFQHQSVVSETYDHEQSWLLGVARGPYINELSRSLFMFLGRKIALLAIDCRTERMRDEIMCRESYEMILQRCRSELIKGETKHLLVLLGVPIAYPRLNFLENILTSKAMDPIKALGRTGLLGGFVNKFDGGIEILDNLDDHWTAKHHKKERKWLIQELQELAAEKSVRITILGGDVHLAAVGQFHTTKAHGVPKDIDHRYMLNVVSSAIVNEPPPVMLADVLNKRNKIHRLDADTEESMCEVFTRDVDGSPRNNIRLLPHRNYCTINEYQPDARLEPPPQRHERRRSEPEALPDLSTRRFPPGSMGQTGPPISSLRPRSLIRRMSGSRERNTGGLKPEHIRAYSDSQSGDKPRLTKTRFEDKLEGEYDDDAVFEDDDDSSMDPNFEGGLEITLNVEVDQGAVDGTTKPYGILVPALFYDDPNDNPTRGRSRRPSIIDRIRGVASRRSRSRTAYSDASHSSSDRSDSPPSAEPMSASKHAEAFLDGAGPQDPRVRFDDILDKTQRPAIGRRDSQQTPYMTPAIVNKLNGTSSLGPLRTSSLTRRPVVSQSPTSDTGDATRPSSPKTSSDNKFLAYLRNKREQNREALLRYERHRSARLEREKDRKSFTHSVPGLSTRYDAKGQPHWPAGARVQRPITAYDDGDESATPSDTESAGIFTPGDVGPGWTHSAPPWGRRV